MREQRRFIRFEIVLKVDYLVKEEKKIERTGTTKDVSAGGMQLLTSERLETGKKLGLKIFVPKALNPAHLDGVVSWSKEISPDKGLSYASGIEFTSIEEDNKNTFLEFLCSLMCGKIE